MDKTDVPNTAAGRQLRWWLDAIDQPDAMTAADTIARYTRMWPRSPWLESDEAGRNAWKNDWERFGEFVIETIESRSEYEVSIVLAPKEGRRSRITFLVEDEEPYRIRQERWESVYDFDLQITHATDSDAAVLADIERRGKVVLGDTMIATDRGEDYFAAARLMSDVTVFLARIGGDSAGVAWGAQAPGRFNGNDINITYFFHLRIVPEHQRKGLWGALDNAVWARFSETTDLYVGYYMIENPAWAHVAEQVQSQPGFKKRDWVPTVYRLLLPAASLAAASPSARRATPDDAQRIVDILNAFHDGEVFYIPYTVESLSARLERDPTYSWDNVLVSDSAVLGLWPAGEKIQVVTERGDDVTRSRRGHVMDYGFVPGAEDEFGELLGAWASDLDRRGIDSVSIFTSKGARGQGFLRPLKATVEAYRFNTGTAAQIDDGAQETGIYTDHLYF